MKKQNNSHRIALYVGLLFKLMKKWPILCLLLTLPGTELMANPDSVTNTATVTLLTVKNWRATALIENHSNSTNYFEINPDPYSKDRSLVLVRYDVFRDGKWDEVVIYRDAGISGRKLATPPQGKEMVYIDLGGLQQRITLPASIRVRVFVNGHAEPLVSNTIIVPANKQLDKP